MSEETASALASHLLAATSKGRWNCAVSGGNISKMSRS